MTNRTYSILAIALITTLAACGTDTTNPPVSTPVDSGSSSGGASDTTATNDDAGATDNDAATSSSGGTDAGAPQDAGPTKPVKCQPTDSACIETCSTAACSKEIKACETDTKCVGYIQCLGGCQNGTEPPGNPEGDTCAEKCSNIAGKDAVGLAILSNACTLEKCVEIKKCQQSDQQCASICAQAKCATEVLETQGDKNTGKITACLQGCQGGTTPAWPPVGHKPDVALLPGGVTPTTCTGKCFHSFPLKSIARVFAQDFCLLSSCVIHNYTAPCPQTNNTCITGCRFDKCGLHNLQCSQDPACLDFLVCSQIKSCSTQDCLSKCQQFVLDKHGAADANSANQSFSSILGCLQTQCLGQG